MKIDNELELDYIRIIQKTFSERTISEESRIKKRNHLIESQFEWKPKIKEKLILLNEKLREEEKRVFGQYRLIEKQSKEMVKNKTIDDYEIDIKVSYWKNKYYKKYYPSIEGNPFFFISIDDFMSHQLDEAEYDPSPNNEHHENARLPEISHCYTFHSLYDHCHELTWFDIYNIDEFWMEIKVHYQFLNDLNPQNKLPKTETVPRKTIKDTLNKNYRFDNLIKGESNHLASSTGLWVTRNLANHSFNPLIIVGGIGFGKTHLANAIGNEVQNCYPDKNVRYVSTSDFIQEHVGSIKKNKRNKLKERCLSADLLIMEDIQLLSGKFGTQEIMIEIVNHFIQNEKQFILTSDRALIEMTDVNPQLLSSFKGGLMVELSLPNYEMRIAILKNIFANENIKITEEIMAYIAKNIVLNTREIQGFCTRLVADSSVNKEKITFALAKTLIEKLKN
ncbi:DnaA ATPase domain-containing protein [Flavobacterium sp. N3904]|uniref:DnaA ATPase domain-containing protein n=1 Tax=Flavobacterium sp. N3904 TaxID=2986835 RepID=UPI00222496B1|nr:DnaA/Hda family protein [Flavobacterium sp. N3904]